MVNLVHKGLPGHQETTVREVMMGMSDLGDCQVNLDLVGYLDQRDLLGPPDLTAFLAWTVQSDLKVVWGLKVSQDLPVSKETQVHRVFQVLRVQLGRQEKRGHLENLVYRECREQMVRLVIQVKKAPQERKEARDLLDHKGQLGIQDHAVSRELMESVV